MKTDDTHHLKNFIDTVNRADNTRQKEVKFDIETIKRVRNALNVLLLRLVDKQANTTSENEVQMDGGDFR
tara:strand:- start:328 stop:537 length:210 start_codon:yes stop_codon:yes gene_type:complete